MSKAELIHIGTFGEPVGLKGEIKIITYTSNFKSFARYRRIVNKNASQIWDLKIVRMSNKKIVGKIKNMNTRESVEALRGKKLFVERINLPKTKRDEFYIVDLISCEVVLTNNKVLGLVQNIENYGAGNLMNIKKTNKKDFLIPMNKENIVSIDLKNKIIIVDPIKGMVN